MKNHNVLNVGKLSFGKGLPKICVPLTGEGIPALAAEWDFVSALPADLFEWRADCYFGDPLEALPFVEERLGERVLLCTVRTENEGGKAGISPESYERLVGELIRQGKFQLVDIELSCGEERVVRLLELAKARGKAAVVSRHNFAATPPEEEIYETLLKMKALGASLPKYAVMPQSPPDVLALLSATWRAYREIGPVITMAMGPLGKLTRAAGGCFGSCLTFAAGKNASAPGQMKAEDLKAILEDLCLEAEKGGSAL